MGTRNHPIRSNQPCFVTAVTRNREPIFGNSQAAELFLTELGRLREKLEFALLGYVVMPDHIHVVIVPSPIASLSSIMQAVKGRFSRLWNSQSERDGALWQSRYYESAVRTEEQLIRWLEYVAHNPIRAGLAS